MGLFGSYRNPGPGINPYAPKKKPFFRFWELLWRNLGKLLSLNILLTLMHAPLLLSMIIFVDFHNNLAVPMSVLLLVIQFFLVGPTLAGASRVLRLIVLDKAFFLWEEFKKGFSRNFGAALLYWFIDFIVIASVYAGWQFYPQLYQKTGSYAVYIPYIITLGAALILLFMNFYLFPLQTATALRKKSVLKNAFMLAVLSPKQCLITLGGIILMLGIALTLIAVNGYLMFILAFFPAAFIGYLVLFVNYPVIQKYVINPYYESTGEENPEEEAEAPEEDRVFTDRGGTEEPVKQQSAKKGKIIS